MARNCKLRCAAYSQYRFKERECGDWDDYPASKSGRAVASTNLSRRRTTGGRHFERPAVGLSGREKHRYPQLVVALMTMGLGAGVLAANLIDPEKFYSPFANGGNALFLSTPSLAQVPYVEMASVAPAAVGNYGRRIETVPSRERDSSSVHHRLNVKKLVATPVPAYLIETGSEVHRDTEAAFAPKRELAHEYWRAMIGASNVIERYQLYLRSYPSGIMADSAAGRIRELVQEAEKTTSSKIRQRVAKAKKSQSTSKQTNPDTVQTAVALSIDETNAVQCEDQNGLKCRRPLKTLVKDCSSSTGLNLEGVCVRKNYRASTAIKR
jgi:hypothetical protein